MTENKSEQPWQPLSRIERRVIGTLVEKAKTTPQQYPLSLNALVTGCNQKTNRAPVMELDQEQVDTALERLRHLGACVEVNADSRTPRYRHTMYEWLGLDKVEMAVLTELLLRGAQTTGELRGRAARMDPIDSVAALRPVLASLAGKNLIFYLTPPGRGCVLTHNLYEPREMDKLREQYGTPPQGYSPGDEPFDDDAGQSEVTDPPETPPNRGSEGGSQRQPPAAAVTESTPRQAPRESTAVARPPLDEATALREEIHQLKRDLIDTRTELEASLARLESDLADIRRQLGC